MKTMSLVVGAAVSAVVSGALIGRNGPQPPQGDQDYEYVTKVQVGSEDNYGYLTVLGNFHPIHGCSNTAYARTQLDLSDKKTDMQLRIAATSYVIKRPVHVWTVNCTPDGYPIMTRIQIQDTYSPTVTGGCPAGQRLCGQTCVLTSQPCPCPAGTTRKCPGDNRCYPPTQLCP